MISSLTLTLILILILINNVNSLNIIKYQKKHQIRTLLRQTSNDNNNNNDNDNELSKRNYNPFKKIVSSSSHEKENNKKNYNPYKKIEDYIINDSIIDNNNNNNNVAIEDQNKEQLISNYNQIISTNDEIILDNNNNNNNNNNNQIKNDIETILKDIRFDLMTQWKLSLINIKKNPLSFILIPICAAIIGYITNWVGVNMLFYPSKWWGIPIYKIEGQPLGFFGWQGIVPAKRVAMATRIVEITISNLISIPEVFNRLKPYELAKLLIPTIKESFPIAHIPGISSVLDLLLRKTSKSIIKNVENIVDIKTLVVSGLTTNSNVLVNLFQKVGHKELKFLIDSGFGFGFLLGLLQMIQWMFLPYNWTLPVGGAIVGYVTNWIALKWIFEPLNPTKVGPFILQGLFLRRQKEVSKDFSEYICNNVLTSPKVWQSMLEGPKSNNFIDIIKKYTKIPHVSNTVMAKLITDVGGSITHPIHEYTEKQLNLKNILIQKMNQMSSTEFEKVLHPVFQEDEITLIIAGGVLGALSGLFQWGFNVWLEKRNSTKNLTNLKSN